jgi:hypothetical protein
MKELTYIIRIDLEQSRGQVIIPTEDGQGVSASFKAPSPRTGLANATRLIESQLPVKTHDRKRVERTSVAG